LETLEAQNVSIANENSRMIEILTNMGANYVQIKEYENAKKIYCRTIKEIKGKLGECKDSATCWQSLADIYFTEKRYTDALSCYDTALRIVTNLSYKTSRIDLLKRKGSCYLHIHKFEKARTNLSEALKLKTANCVDDKSNGEIAGLRAELGLSMYWSGDRDQALKYWNQALDVEMTDLTHHMDGSVLLKCIEKYLQIGE
jgi:tetratricopeptide (TPR) repeat protein